MARRKLAALAIAGLAAAGAAAQNFEVVSVKLVKDCGAPVAIDMPGKKANGVKKGGIRAVSPGRLHVCTDLGELIRNAYVVYAEDRAHPPRAVEGGPGWIQSELYDVNAKAEDAADQATMMGPMLRAVLTDRFHLKIRHETREIPVYELTVGKDGPKLQATVEGSCTPTDYTKPVPPQAPGEKPHCGTSSIEGKHTFAELNMIGTEMAQFTSRLGGLLLDRPVVDKTGLTGTYDIHFEFGYDSPGLKFHPPMADDTPGGGPSIFAAIQKLGLKLEAGKNPADFLVIESAQRPSGN